MGSTRSSLARAPQLPSYRVFSHHPHPSPIKGIALGFGRIQSETWKGLTMMEVRFSRTADTTE